MARVDFNSFNAANNSQEQRTSVGFFSLKDDGDEAIVRIMHDSIDSFDIVTGHNIRLGDKWRKVNCLRESARDNLDDCPFCKAGMPVQSRIFIHLIEYVPDERGNFIPYPRVWERSANVYAKQLKDLLDEYGPLSNCVFKIRRAGRAGSVDTSYSIMYGNPNMYTEEKYPKVNNAFDNYSVIGTIVLDKNATEMNSFLVDGAFPEVMKRDNNSASSVNQLNVYKNQPSYTQAPQPSYTQQNNYNNPPAFNEPIQPEEKLPWEEGFTPTTPNYNNYGANTPSNFNQNVPPIQNNPGRPRYY